MTKDPFREDLVALIPKLRSYALGFARTAAEADDLVQDALVRAWRYRDRFEPETNLAGWVFRILRNEFLTQLPAKGRLVQDVDGQLAAQLSLEPDQEWRLHYGELMEAVRKLPHDSREALLLVGGLGFSNQEAAEICGCEPNTLKQRVFRARQRLAELMDPDPPPARPRSGMVIPMPRVAGLAIGVLAIAFADPLQAQEPLPSEDRLARIERLLADQDRKLAEQSALIERQADEIRMLKALAPETLSTMSATGSAPILTLSAPAAVAQAQAPAQPVGVEQRAPEQPQEVAIATTTNIGVLTPQGELLLDPSVEFVRTSNNRLVFRGVEIVPGFNIGVIEASDVARDTAVATLAARYGLTDRLELEVRAPYVYRHDRIARVASTENNFEQVDTFQEWHWGDVEAALRYQVNSGANGWPIFVTNLRVKSDTGRGPYDVPFDDFGVAQDVATGSGFWSVEVGSTLLYQSDPAVIFAGLSYLHNFGKDLSVPVRSDVLTRVEPGDGVSFLAGFGLSLNPRFSVSLGYTYNYIMETESRFQQGGVLDSRPVHIGAMQMGLSYRISDRLVLNNTLEFGLTGDAPDMRLVFRTPYRF